MYRTLDIEVRVVEVTYISYPSDDEPVLFLIGGRYAASVSLTTGITLMFLKVGLAKFSFSN